MPIGRHIVRSVGASVGALLLMGSAPPAAVPAYLQISDGVGDGAIAEDGSLWFAPWNEDERFTLDASPDDVQAAFTLLRLAAEAGASVDIRFDPSSGALDAKSGRVSYRLCAIGYGSQRIGGEADFCSARASAHGRSAAEREIALGVAWEVANRPHEAITPLDAALSRSDLSPSLRLAAVRARQAVHFLLSLKQPRLSADADKELIAALADARTWATLAPDDHEAAFAVGWILEELGAYDEALAFYAKIASQWPEEYFRTEIRIAAIHRIRGDLKGALAAIDDSVSRDRSNAAMKYHYHRGWVLTLMGRYDEAVADFTDGMQTQPDYAYAYLRRACAYGQLGEIAEALSDDQAGAAMLARRSAALDPDSRRDLDHVRSVILPELQKAADAKLSRPTGIACELSDPETLRPRSALLPAAT